MNAFSGLATTAAAVTRMNTHQADRRPAWSPEWLHIERGLACRWNTWGGTKSISFATDFPRNTHFVPTTSWYQNIFRLRERGTTSTSASSGVPFSGDLIKDAMSGVEIVGLVSVFQTCIHGYRHIHRFIRSYKSIDEDFVELDLRLEETIAYLWSFGRVHNLIVENGEITAPALTTGGFSPSWTNLAENRLVTAREHLLRAQAIVGKYNAADASNRPRDVQLYDEPEPFDETILPTDSPRLLRTDSSLSSRKGSIRGLGIRKKLTWTKTDKEELTEVVQFFERDVSALFNLTMPRFWVLMHEATASTLKNTGIYVETAALLNRQPLHEPLDREQRVIKEMQALRLATNLGSETDREKFARKLDFASCFPDLSQEELPARPTRKEARLARASVSQQVLVEWKAYDPKKISREEVIRRVSDVVAILNSPLNFLHNILPSPGFFEDDRYHNSPYNWVGVVYDMTPLGNTAKMRTLRDLLTRPAAESSKKPIELWKPPLGDRFKLALRIAETILTVHNCGWLHKGISPENVVLLPSRGEPVADPDPMGWECSRSRKPDQKSEELQSWYTDAELYQHPEYFEEVQPDESRYKLHFDHYQLGCVLLEIGMWRLLGELTRPKKVPGDDDWSKSWRLKLREKAERLAVDMGEIYSKVVLNLLTGIDSEGREGEFWDVVVLQLSHCRA